VSRQSEKLVDFDAPVIDLNAWRRCYLAGEVALTRAQSDPQFKTRLLDALDRILTDPDDRALFGLPRNPPPGI
jgi:hypothetical protein